VRGIVAAARLRFKASIISGGNVQIVAACRWRGLALRRAD
jgi:hypothetical protein